MWVASISATRARVVASSSPSSRPARARIISPSAQKLIPSPYAGLRPSCHQTCSTSPSTYLRNSHASRVLPIPAGPDDRDEPRALLPRGRVVQVLEQPQLVVAADERRLERLAATAAPLGDDPQRDEGRDRARLALERLLAGGLEGDRPRGRSPGRLADEHGSRGGRRLEPGRRVDEVAGHEALVGRAQRDRGLAGQDAGPRLDARAEDADRVDQLEAGPHGSLGVVLVGRRGAPDGHHRVADELLDGAAVAADDVRGELEVPAQGLAHLLRVAALREGREADQVREQDRHDPPLGERGSRGLGGRRTRPRRRWRPARPAPIGTPHEPQNRALGSFGSPHAGHAEASAVPHSRQKRRDAALVAPQLAQTMPSSPDPLGCPPSAERTRRPCSGVVARDPAAPRPVGSAPMARPALPSFIGDLVADRRALGTLAASMAALLSAGLDPKVYAPMASTTQAAIRARPDLEGLVLMVSVTTAVLVLVGGAIGDSTRARPLILCGLARVARQRRRRDAARWARASRSSSHGSWASRDPRSSCPPRWRSRRWRTRGSPGRRRSASRTPRTARARGSRPCS